MDTADANAATWADAAEAHPAAAEAHPTATETHPATAEAHAAAAEAHPATPEAHAAAAEVHPATPAVETTAAAVETATAAVETATATAVETAAAATRFRGQWRCKERRRHQQHCTNCNFAIFHGHLPAVMCTYAVWLSARRHTSCGAFTSPPPGPQ